MLAVITEHIYSHSFSESLLFLYFRLVPLMSLEFEKSPLDKSTDFRVRLNALPVQIVFDVVSCTTLSDTVRTLYVT